MFLVNVGLIWKYSTCHLQSCLLQVCSSFVGQQHAVSSAWSSPCKPATSSSASGCFVQVPIEATRAGEEATLTWKNTGALQGAQRQSRWQSSTVLHCGEKYIVVCTIRCHRAEGQADLCWPADFASACLNCL